ncbi:MAG: short-chain dehydrogenase/reductase [Verrucomicrobiaceae bacterium]|nr:short-chain dehydrogenase/reductase [Verrucomicrobiaceae bacterium]
MIDNNKKVAVITGVSTGIGHGITRVLIDAGWIVFGSVRKPADADRLSTEFGAAFQPLLFDVTDESGVADATKKVRTELGGRTLDALINNAGVVFAGPLLLQPVAEFRSQIEINLVGTHIVTQAFAPLLGADRTLTGTPGRIVNISSVAGKLSTPMMGAYSASKYGLEGYSDALRRELVMYGIKVVIINPGSIKSPVFDKNDPVEKAYAGTDYANAIKVFLKVMHEGLRTGYTPEQLGKVALTALTVAKPKIRYAVVPGRLQNWILPQLLPTRTVDAVMAKVFATSK